MEQIIELESMSITLLYNLYWYHRLLPVLSLPARYQVLIAFVQTSNCEDSGDSVLSFAMKVSCCDDDDDDDDDGGGGGGGGDDDDDDDGGGHGLGLGLPDDDDKTTQVFICSPFKKGRSFA